MARIVCGCGIGMNNPEQAAEHARGCEQPQVDIGEMKRTLLDTGLDYSYAFGYEGFCQTRRELVVLAYNR